MTSLRWVFLFTILLPYAAPSQDPAVRAAFHHVHLNSLDPNAAADFYVQAFPMTSRVTVAGMVGVRSDRVYLLFDEVGVAPLLEPPSAVWHFGWGSPTPGEDVAKHLKGGVPFYSPIARLPSGTEFAYMKGPDGATIEINTGATRSFTHVHLYSDDPIAAGEWYEARLGAEHRGGTPRTSLGPVPFGTPSEPGGVIRSPSATVRLGDVNLIIYPRQTPRLLASTRGHVVDHIGVTCSDVVDALARLNASGVATLEAVHPFGNGQGRAAMVEGPDRIAIELVEK